MNNEIRSELWPWFDNLWLWKEGKSESDLITIKKVPPLDELRISEWDADFENKMRARLVLGCIRYGAMGHGSVPKGKKKRDRVKSIIDRIKLFQQSGNGEHLVDAANECLLIYTERDHPNFHFESADDGYHTPEKK